MIADFNAPPAHDHLAALLAYRAALHPHRPAVSFLSDTGETQSLTYGALYHRAAAVACQLHAQAAPGARAAMLFPPGLEFVVGFFACAQAGLVPTPACFPKAGRPVPRLDSVVSDARPEILLADRQTLQAIAPGRMSPAITDLRWIATDDVPEVEQPPEVQITSDMLGLLQYTSGSTSEPRGVMVSHRNLLSNLEAIRRSFGIAFQSPAEDEVETGVFWLPAFHDMGLIGGILAPLYVGGHTVLMSPQSFLAQPIRWLETISRFGATTSGAPNFAYQLCVDRCTREAVEKLDLSRWRLAFCGAEPIRAETLQEFARLLEPCGFDAGAFYPCYGLAESTLLAAGPDGPAVPQILEAEREALGQGQLVMPPPHQAAVCQKLVACGCPVHGTTLRIVQVKTRQPCGEGEIGEIWLAGPSVAQGYFGRPEATEQVFRAFTAAGEGPFLRTGDLGAIYDGQLYVTGRLKDVLILRGRNLYPQDIERTTVTAIGEGAGKCAAFGIAGPFGEELSIVAEVPRHTDQQQWAQLARQIRAAVAEQHEADIRHLRLVRHATVPVTSSGKVQRDACRRAMLENRLRVRFSWDRAALSINGVVLAPPKLTLGASAAAVDAAAAKIQQWLLQWLIDRAGVTPTDAVAERPFAEFGLDSLASVELSSELADWLGLDLSPVLAWNYPTPEKLSHHLARRLAQLDEPTETPPGASHLEGDGRALDEAELETLLSEVEHLSDAEINAIFAAHLPQPPRTTV